MRFIWLVRLIFAALLPLLALDFAGCPAGAKGPDKEAPQQTFVIPFVPLLHHGAPIVTLRINDSEEASFMVDTGADDCFMTEALAKKLGLKRQPALRGGFSLNYGGPEHTNYVAVDDVKIGNLDLGKANFLVMHGLNGMEKGDTPVSGMIGLTFLAHFSVFLDYQRHVMALIYPGKLSEEDVRKLGFSDPQTIRAPLEKLLKPIGTSLYKESEYSTTITLKNGDRTETVKPYVDTGAPSTIISRKPAARLKLNEERPSASRTYATGLAVLSKGSVQELTIGGVTIHGEHLTFPGDNGEGFDFPELLGSDVLSFCNVLLDYPGKALYLRPVLPPLVPSVPPTAATVDRERLRAAATLPVVAAGINEEGDSDRFDESAADVAQRIAELKAEIVKDTGDAFEKAHRWDALGSAERRSGGDAATVQEAFSHSVALYGPALATAESITDLKARRAAFDDAAKAYSDAGEYDEAIRIARRAAVSAAPGEWRPLAALGAAQHRKAAFLLSGSTALVWDDIPFDEARFWRVRRRLRETPLAPDVVAIARALSDDARDAFDNAVKSAPRDAAALLARADYRIAEGLDVDTILAVNRKAEPDLTKLAYDYGVRDDVIAASLLRPGDPDLIARSAFLEVVCTAAQNAQDIGYRDQQLWDLLPVRTRKAAEGQIARLRQLADDPSDKTRAARARALLGCIEFRYLEAEGDNGDAENDIKLSLSLNARDTLPLRALYNLYSVQRRYSDLLPI